MVKETVIDLSDLNCQNIPAVHINRQREISFIAAFTDPSNEIFCTYSLYKTATNLDDLKTSELEHKSALFNPIFDSSLKTTILDA
jgi:hypothetical protein